MKLLIVLLSTLFVVSLSACAQRLSVIAENTPGPQPGNNVAPTPSPLPASLKPHVNEIKFVSTENYQNWNITPEGIMISFDDYQVGPHSAGQPVLIIPYSVLKDLIDRGSALDTLLDNDA
jgi:hypothetical protein